MRAAVIRSRTVPVLCPKHSLLVMCWESGIRFSRQKRRRAVARDPFLSKPLNPLRLMNRESLGSDSTKANTNTNKRHRTKSILRAIDPAYWQFLSGNPSSWRRDFARNAS